MILVISMTKTGNSLHKQVLWFKERHATFDLKFFIILSSSLKQMGISMFTTSFSIWGEKKLRLHIYVTNMINQAKNASVEQSLKNILLLCSAQSILFFVHFITYRKKI